MSRARVFVGVIALQLAALAGLGLHGRYAAKADDNGTLPAKQRLVAALQLTDLAVWTEARYTRHPSQADFFSPFQDFPSSFEHFPAGSVLAPARYGSDPDATPVPPEAR